LTEAPARRREREGIRRTGGGGKGIGGRRRGRGKITERVHMPWQRAGRPRQDSWLEQEEAERGAASFARKEGIFSYRSRTSGGG
jgi:hypothetical protein